MLETSVSYDYELGIAPLLSLPPLFFHLTLHHVDALTVFTLVHTR